MSILQSRFDAEFLLAHMCSVKFKEWIVVLATLLRRSEVWVASFLTNILPMMSKSALLVFALLICLLHRFYLIFSRMICGCGKLIASLCRYLLFKMLSIILPALFICAVCIRLMLYWSIVFSHIPPLLNTMIFLEIWKINFHPLELLKRDEVAIGYVYRFSTWQLVLIW